MGPKLLAALPSKLRRMVEDSQEVEAEAVVQEGEHIAPSLGATSFHCMYCGVLAQQLWTRLSADIGPSWQRVPYARCVCRNCTNFSIWSESEERCIDPVIGSGPRPHIDMPDDVKADYEEARRILGQSPRGACALLRLCVQKLCKDLGEKGDNINGDIASLVQKGLPEEVQEAMDSLRVIGNNAVHPGEMDLKDDTETASALFNLLNFVVEEMIAKPKRRRGVFDKLPVSVREAIKKRDGK